MKKHVVIGHHIKVYARDPGDLRAAYIGGESRSMDESARLYQKIASEIRRHVSELPSSFLDSTNGVRVVEETEDVCEHCGYRWSGNDSQYNGGCCAADEDEWTQHQEQSKSGLPAPTDAAREE